MKNIVLLVIDSLRADHMSCYGYKRQTTPFIDTLAKKSLIFKNAFANGPKTRYSCPSFLSSTYPLLFLEEAKTNKFHEGRKSIAEMLKKNGYETAAIHSNPYLSRFYGYNRGFDYFKDFLLEQIEQVGNKMKKNKISKTLHELVKDSKTVFMKKLPYEDGEKINEEVFRWLEKSNEPFFLWVHYMDVHTPYIPPNKFLENLDLKKYNYIKKLWLGKKMGIKWREKIKDEEIKDYINLYDGCIRYVDWLIKKLISKLKEKYDDTLFVITADHGEEFMEHGSLLHGEKLYDELLHVPLIFCGKDIEKKTIEKPVSLISLIPTIFSFLGIQKNKWLQGENVFEANDFIIAETIVESGTLKNERITAYRNNEWKFIMKGNERELYNLKEDAGELNNLYNSKKYGEKVEMFEKILNTHIKMLEEERKRRETWLQKEKTKKAIRKIGKRI